MILGSEFGRSFKAPQQLYINRSSKTKAPQLGLLEPSPSRPSIQGKLSLSVTFESFVLQSKWNPSLVTCDIAVVPRFYPAQVPSRRSPVELAKFPKSDPTKSSSKSDLR